ncbi:Fe-S cluster assembly ATPase SufC [Patescibacteria group bacterium]|nr:Fe-S cluster assembly ATPase SufC [Patescibacteria group bacterium]
MKDALIIKDLKASVEEKRILQGVTLEVEPGKVHALMGPNGAGKSTLGNVLMGHPKYQVTSGSVKFGTKNVLKMSPDERAKLGIFLAFQYPQSVAGLTLSGFLKQAVDAVHEARGAKKLTVMQFKNLLEEKMALLKVEMKFTERYLNDGFSGGEKKRAEILQMAMLEPKIAILDETDSGLDIDALKTVSQGVNALKKDNPTLGVLLITHYQRILNYVKPDFVHVMLNGRIAQSGPPELVRKLEAEGYDWLKETKKPAGR